MAQQFLIERGYQIFQNNFRIRGGELDLIAIHHQQLIFFEIKTHHSHPSNSHKCLASEQISSRQQYNLQRSARHFLFQNRHLKLPINLQFDLLVIHLDQSAHVRQAKIKHLKNIFSA